MPDPEPAPALAPPAVAAELAALIRSPAARHFDRRRGVAHEVVESLVAAARWTGSARNRQPWRFVQVRDRTVIEALAGLGAYAQFVAAAPVVLAVAAADDGYADTDYDTGRVTQSLVLAAAALGLGSCPATVHPARNVAAAARLLRLPASWRPNHLLALGYPAARPAGVSAVPPGRLSVSDLLSSI